MYRQPTCDQNGWKNSIINFYIEMASDRREKKTMWENSKSQESANSKNGNQYVRGRPFLDIDISGMVQNGHQCQLEKTFYISNSIMHC